MRRRWAREVVSRTIYSDGWMRRQGGPKGGLQGGFEALQHEAPHGCRLRVVSECGEDDVPHLAHRPLAFKVGGVAG